MGYFTRLAELSGVTDAQIRRMETGKPVQRLPVENVLKVLGAFEEEIEGLNIAAPVGVHQAFVRGAIMPRKMDVIF